MVSFDTARVFWGAQVRIQPGPDYNLICPVLSPAVCQRVSAPTLLKLPFRSRIWYRVCKMWEEEQISPQIAFSVCKPMLTSCCVPLLHFPNASSGCCWIKILDLSALFFLVRGDFLSHECLLACMALSWLSWVQIQHSQAPRHVHLRVSIGFPCNSASCPGHVLLRQRPHESAVFIWVSTGLFTGEDLTPKEFCHQRKGPEERIHSAM